MKLPTTTIDGTLYVRVSDLLNAVAEVINTVEGIIPQKDNPQLNGAFVGVKLVDMIQQAAAPIVKEAKEAVEKERWDKKQKQ